MGVTGLLGRTPRVVAVVVASSVGVAVACLTAIASPVAGYASSGSSTLASTTGSNTRLLLGVACLIGAAVLFVVNFRMRRGTGPIAGDSNLGELSESTTQDVGTELPDGPDAPQITSAAPMTILMGDTDGQGIEPLRTSGSHDKTTFVFASSELVIDPRHVGFDRVRPQIRDEGVTWTMTLERFVGLSMWSEKRRDKGEDAEPSFVYEEGRPRAMLAVYDGTGGAGGAIARETRRGTLTQAYEASRVARFATEQWFLGRDQVAHDPMRAASELRDQLAGALADHVATLMPSGSQLVGTLKRELPTTLAAVVCEPSKRGVEVTALWAGDSRCYVLTPEAGLQQISKDDTRVSDALDALLADPPMDNLVCADREFGIRTASIVQTVPSIVLVATDGCFGYVPTPPMFEAQILSALQSSQSEDEWVARLLAVFAGQAQDDVSLALVALGFPVFDDVRRAFATRTEFLDRSYLAPFEAIRVAEDGREQFEEFRARSWESYRTGYEARLPETAVAE